MVDENCWNEEFALRFKKHEEELRALYLGLYNNDEQAYDYFVSMLYRLWSERPESLKLIDRGPMEISAHRMVLYSCPVAGKQTSYVDKHDSRIECLQRLYIGLGIYILHIDLSQIGLDHPPGVVLPPVLHANISHCV